MIKPQKQPQRQQQQQQTTPPPSQPKQRSQQQTLQQKQQQHLKQQQQRLFEQLHQYQQEQQQQQQQHNRHSNVSQPETIRNPKPKVLVVSDSNGSRLNLHQLKPEAQVIKAERFTVVEATDKIPNIDDHTNVKDIVFQVGFNDYRKGTTPETIQEKYLNIKSKSNTTRNTPKPVNTSWQFLLGS